jgi:5'-3' exonuclease
MGDARGWETREDGRRKKMGDARWRRYRMATREEGDARGRTIEWMDEGMEEKMDVGIKTMDYLGGIPQRICCNYCISSYRLYKKKKKKKQV